MLVLIGREGENNRLRNFLTELDVLLVDLDDLAAVGTGDITLDWVCGITDTSINRSSSSSSRSCAAAVLGQ